MEDYYTEQQIEYIKMALEDNGYEASYTPLVGFTFRDKDVQGFNRKMAEIDERCGEWSVSTVSSHWTVEEANKMMLEMEAAIAVVERINRILER